MNYKAKHAAVIENGIAHNEFRSLWCLDSKMTICFQFDHESDFWVDWDDGDEPEHITPASFNNISERPHGRTVTEQAAGDDRLLTIYHIYKDRTESGPVLISIFGSITNWKAGNFNYGSSLDMKKYISDDNEPCHLLSIEQFGIVGLGAFAFLNCRELTRLPEKEIPDRRYLTNMSGMFYHATRFNSSLEHWDVSNVNDISGLFYNARLFNQPLNHWNVSNVENMSHLFKDAWNFDHPINHWNVSKVKDMSYMFCGAESFNQPLNHWNVSNVENMTAMFYDAYSFNQPLSKWNVSRVISMHNMFAWAIRFNHPINKWNVSNVKDMSYMFWEAESFNQPLHKWDVSNIENMHGMLHGAVSFCRSLRHWKLAEGIMSTSIFEL